MSIAYDSTEFVFIEDVGPCAVVGVEVFGPKAGHFPRKCDTVSSSHSQNGHVVLTAGFSFLRW